MSFIDAIRYRLRALLSPDTFARERSEEIEHHLELERSSVRAESASPLGDDEARLAAKRRFGGVTYTNEERRMISGLAVLDSAGQDLRFVGRLLRRRATFAAVTIATIALGIGAAASIYSVADAVLFRSLAFPNPGRLTTVWLTRPRWKQNPGLVKRWDRGSISLPGFREWRARQTSFDDVAIWVTYNAIIGGNTSPEEVLIARTSASLAGTLGIHPALGAWFTERDDVVGGAPVAVIGYEAWSSRFGADPRVLGMSAIIDGETFRIVGVAPRGLSLDRGPANVSYWIPASRDSAEANNPSSFGFQAIGRLKAGIPREIARVEAGRILRAAASGDNSIEGAALMTLQDDQTRLVRRPLLLLLAAATLLLAIACINVATLLLGEAATREAELRTRTALGATRRRLIRQLLTESVLLSSIGAVLGIALAAIGTRLIVRASPATIPGLADVHVNVRLVLLASMVTVATGILFGLLPAISLTKRAHSLGDATGKHSARGRGRGQRALIACEVALSMVLLVGAGLLLRSFGKLSSVGFEPRNFYVLALRLRQQPFDDSIHARALFTEVQQRLRNLPGVAAVALTTTPPFSNGSSTTSFEVEGRPSKTRAPQSIAYRRATSPDFFSVAGIPVVAGRSYDESDRAGAPLVVVVSHALAQSEWPGESAIGKRIRYMGAWRTVVGVVSDIATERPTVGPPETVYTPLAQLMLRGTPSIVVRMRDAGIDATAIRHAVQSVDDGVSVGRVDAMDHLIRISLADDRLRTVLFLIFAALAAVLAGVGTYGVAATSAYRRMREVAIRLAVGATSASIARLIIGSAAAGVALGVASGLVLALAGARVLSPYLFGVTQTDPTVYAGVALLLAAATVAATWIPARRAMRVRLVDTLAKE